MYRGELTAPYFHTWTLQEELCMIHSILGLGATQIIHCQTDPNLNRPFLSD